MKKFLSIIFLLSLSVAVFGQRTLPRFGTLPNQDNTGRALTYAYSAPAYAATLALSPNAYQTTVNVGLLTGNITITAGVKGGYSADQLVLIVTADATGRTVTLSTGFTSRSTPISVPAGLTKIIEFVFNGVTWVETGTGSLPSIKTASAINVTATATAAQVAAGLITSTSPSAVTITLPTATQMAAQLGAVQGSIFDFIVDNSAGANTVTIAVGAGITASTFPATNTLTLANSTTTGTALFRLTFISGTAATLTRIN